MSGTKNSTLLVIRDNNNAASQTGFNDAEYTVVCANAKTAKAMAGVHAARNWPKDDMGPLPTKLAELLRKYFRDPEDDSAEAWTLPSGELFTPEATYDIFSAPTADEERAVKLLEKESKGAIKSGKVKEKSKTEDDSVGSRA
jgi:hypothetical protein